MSFGIYNPEDQVLSSDAVISPMWDDRTTVLSTFFTSSTQEAGVYGQFTQGTFFLDVYKDNPFLTSSLSPQFSIAYGHISGSGSSYFNALVDGKTPTRDIYGQFRSLIYGDENTAFQFGGSTYTSKDIIIISVSRAKFKESFNPGSFFLALKSGSNSIGLVDDSTVTTTSTYIGTSRVYQLLSGSYNASTGVSTPSSSNYTVSGSYGLMIPDEGLIILNPRALALSSGPLGGIGAIFNEFSASQAATFFSGLGTTYNLNNRMMFDMMSSAPTFSLQSYETISSRYFFTRVKNSEFNYTSNPTIIDSNGNLLFTTLVYNPQTFITTIGMYNNSGDLLAIAKLNKPLVKDFTKELLLRVKLDF
jgi:hypothetical protein